MKKTIFTTLMLFSINGANAVGLNFEPTKNVFTQSITFVETEKCERAVISQLITEGVKASGMLSSGSYKIDGLSLKNKKNQCYVFYQRPKDSTGYEMMLLGHEVAHCIYGNYHDVPELNKNGKELEIADQSIVIELFADAILNSCELSESKQNQYLDIWQNN